VGYGAAVLFFGGTGLVISFLIENKLSKKKESWIDAFRFAIYVITTRKDVACNVFTTAQNRWGDKKKSRIYFVIM